MNEQIAQAVARGWCHPNTEHKVMDEALAVAIVEEVEGMLASEKERAEEFQKARIARFEKLAETDLKYLQGTPIEIAKRLADLEDVLEPAAFTAHVQMLKSASAQIAKSGTFRPVGAGGSESGSAYDAIVSKARELMKSDAKLTEAKAITKITKDPTNLELVKRYREERAGAN